MLSTALVRDGAPRRLRLLGEDFVAFRDTLGRVGVLDEACPHRGVSLAMGRNEECGLRCLFHGWKLDVRGSVVEVPNQPIAGFAERIVPRHHPVEEAGGIVWVYLGHRDPAPPRPNLSFAQLPTAHVFVMPGLIHANWLPVIEAGFDQEHVRILHQSVLATSFENVQMASTMLSSRRTRFEFERRPYGGSWRFLEQADQELEEEVRVGEFIFPWWDLIGLSPDPDHDQAILLNVPVDDETTMLWGIFYNTEHPLREGDVGRIFASHCRSAETYRTDLPGREQNWGQDRDAMKEHWTGIGVGRGGVGLFYEDIALMESINPSWDRSREHLAPSDTLISRLRHILTEALRERERGDEVSSVTADVTDVLPRFTPEPSISSASPAPNHAA
jgi:phenylpropionate dioxygenase-like ring-hydroxylating dioxygenase large terminal subunit